MSEDCDKCIDLVNNKIYFVLKDDLLQFALSKNFINSEDIKRCTKDDVMSHIKNNIDQKLAIEVIKQFKDKIGFTSSEIEDILNITNAERIKWTKKKILNVTGYYQVRAYGTYLDCPIYDAMQIMSLSGKDIEEIRSSIRKPSAKQLEALERGRKKSIENRTCKGCKSIFKIKKALDEDGLCYLCATRKKALEHRRYWMQNKDKYVILDVETTGLGYYDEIVEIGIIDLDGNILINQLVNPSQVIPEEAICIHGITNEMVSDAPTWDIVYPKIKGILNDKIIIAYNASFDIDMIENSCRKYSIKPEKMNYECLMYNTMDAWGTDRFVSLQNAIDGNLIQDHRSVGDCKLCLELIKNN